MNYKLLTLTLALTSASGLWGANASASASASATARADDPANHAQPETDTKSGEADVKSSSAQTPLPKCIADQLHLAKQCLQESRCHFSSRKGCTTSYATGDACEHLKDIILSAVVKHHRQIHPPYHWDLEVADPMFSQSEAIPFAVLWNGLEQHTQLPKDLARLVHDYTHDRVVDCHIRIVDPQHANNTSTYLGRFNFDTGVLTTDGQPIDDILAEYGLLFKNNCPQSPAHPNAPYIHCLTRIKNNLPCEHMKPMVLAIFKASSHAEPGADDMRYTFLDGKLFASGHRAGPAPDRAQALIQDTYSGEVYECEFNLGARTLITAKLADKKLG